MKYTPIDEKIPQERRQELNEKILYLINSGRAAESVSYTHLTLPTTSRV